MVKTFTILAKSLFALTLLTNASGSLSQTLNSVPYHNVVVDADKWMASLGKERLERYKKNLETPQFFSITYKLQHNPLIAGACDFCHKPVYGGVFNLGYRCAQEFDP